MAEKEVRKTTAKRVVRRTTAKTAPRKVAARTATTVSARKAPSRILTTRSSKSSKLPFVMATFFLVILGASAAIGYSDKGQLDVVHAITERKENATAEEKELFKTVPVQKQNADVPNGGLVGIGKNTVPTPPPVVEQSTTTDTTVSATTTITDISDSDTDVESGSENVEEEIVEDPQEAQ